MNGKLPGRHAGVLSALLTLTLAVAPASLGAPPKKVGNAAKTARTAPKAAASASVPAPVLDPQTLVDRGKRPAFYDPNDLSRAPVLSAKAALLMDADTGRILWGKNGYGRRAPASTTKILTALLLIEHTQPDDVVTVMDPSVKNIEPSSLHLKPWEKLTAEDLLYGLMLRSANDGAVVAAQHVGGSVAKFAEMMNQRAHELGATDSQFRNPNGLPQDGHYTTAHDLAVIARAALLEPRFADAVGTPRRTIARSKNQKDVLLVTKARKFYEKFPGADGIKTGYTRAAGHCFVGSATRDGRRLLSVILGARSSATDETIPLLAWGFRRFPAVQVAQAGQTVGSVRVRGGREDQVPALAGGSLQIVTDMTAGPPVTTEVEGGPVRAPVAAGQEVGRLVAKVGPEARGSVPLRAAQPVARSLGATIWRGAAWIGGLLLGVGMLLLGVLIIGTKTAKSARRRRRRLAATGRGDDRGGPRRGGGNADHYPRNTRRPRPASDYRRR